MAVPVDPYTFTNGTVADGLEVNARFNPLYSVLNGGLDSTNMDLTATFAWTGTHSFAATTNFTGFVNLGSGAALSIGDELYFDNDGGDNTHIHCPVDDTLRFTVGGQTMVEMVEGASNYTKFYHDIVLDSDDVLTFDGVPAGSSNNQMWMSAPGNIKLKVGGTDILNVQSNNLAVQSGIGLLLPNTDPPTANYGTRNSFVKAWVDYDDGAPGSIADSYNVASVTDDDGDGRYDINWDTNFNDADYAFVGMTASTFTTSYGPATSAGTGVILCHNPTIGFQDTSFKAIAIGDQ